MVAIGNPFGLGGTATAGIVSAEGRDIGDGPYDHFLQIDAPINKGNSGGPTFNLKGEVVGVNTAIYSPSGGSVGIGFAIPASTVDSVVDALEHGGVVKRGYLGVEIQPVSQDIADSLGLKAARGAIVDQADAGNAGRGGRSEARRRDHQAQRPAGQGCGRSDPSRRLVEARRQGRAHVPARRRRQDRRRHACGAERTTGRGGGDGAERRSRRLLGVELSPAKQVSAPATRRGHRQCRSERRGRRQGSRRRRRDPRGRRQTVSDPDQVKSDIAASSRRERRRF